MLKKNIKCSWFESPHCKQHTESIERFGKMSFKPFGETALTNGRGCWPEILEITPKRYLDLVLVGVA